MSCGEAHNTLDKNCSVFLDEVEINKIKTENRITYGEAKRIRRRQCPTIPKNYTTEHSYAQKTKTKTNAPSPKPSTSRNSDTKTSENNQNTNTEINNLPTEKNTSLTPSLLHRTI